MNLKQLLGLCEHKYNIICTINVTTDFGSTYTRYHLQCERCGVVKTKNMH